MTQRGMSVGETWIQFEGLTEFTDRLVSLTVVDKRYSNVVVHHRRAGRQVQRSVPVGCRFGDVTALLERHGEIDTGRGGIRPQSQRDPVKAHGVGVAALVE